MILNTWLLLDADKIDHKKYKIHLCNSLVSFEWYLSYMAPYYDHQRGGHMHSKNIMHASTKNLQYFHANTVIKM